MHFKNREEHDNLQRENHLDSDSSNNPPNSEGGVDACIATRDDDTPQQGNPALVLWHFLQVSEYGEVRVCKVWNRNQNKTLL